MMGTERDLRERCAALALEHSAHGAPVSQVMATAQKVYEFVMGTQDVAKAEPGQEPISAAAISAAAQAWADEHVPPASRMVDTVQALHDDLARFGTAVRHVPASAPRGKEGRRISVLLTRRGVHGPGGDRRVGSEDRRSGR